MELLAIFNPENCSEETGKNLTPSLKVRGIVFAENGKIIMAHVGKYNFLQEPGGSVEEGESLEESFKRECIEEIGVNIKDLQEIGIVEIWRPKDNRRSMVHGFVAKVDSYLSSPALTEREEDENYSVVSISIEEAVQTVKNQIEKLKEDKDKQVVFERSLVLLNKAKELL